MTHTLSIDRVGGTPADVSIVQLDRTYFDKVGIATYDPKTGTGKCTYTIASGDRLYPSTVVVSNTLAPNGAEGAQRHVTIDFNTWARDVDNDGLVKEKVQPIHARIQWDVPSIAVDVGDVQDMLANAFTLLYTTLTSKVMDTGIISATLWGGTELYG